jgi:phosphoglucosamine mutase
VAALAAGITAAGGSVLDAGVLPTPALAHLSERRQLPAAMVTASHNPWHDNGVKVFAAGGTKLPDEVERAIEQAVHDGAAPSAVSVASSAVDAAEEYVAHLVTQAGRLDGLRVVLDCANGAMSAVAPAAFTSLGATVRVIHATPNGRNINEQCGATYVASLAAEVRADGADLGLAFDGDGDRVIAVDHLGNVVDGDRLIALAALHLNEQGRLRHRTVVVTVMSNLGFHRAMSAAGIEVVTTAVGDRSVLEALEQGGYSLGGEQSGHIIYRELATTGDGLLAALRLAEFVHGHHAPLATLAAEVMDSYPQVLVNVRVADRHPDAAAALAAEIAAAEQRLGGEGRILVRASGTEPLIRVMVEAPTAAAAQSIADEVAAHVRQRFG